MMVFSIESIEKLNHREHGDALKKNARQHITTDLSDFMVLDGHSRITILRDRFKDIKFVKSANARLRMNQEKDPTRLL
jgi:nucleoside diphosphate kinase